MPPFGVSTIPTPQKEDQQYTFTPYLPRRGLVVPAVCSQGSRTQRSTGSVSEVLRPLWLLQQLIHLSGSLSLSLSACACVCVCAPVRLCACACQLCRLSLQGKSLAGKRLTGLMQSS